MKKKTSMIIDLACAAVFSGTAVLDFVNGDTWIGVLSIFAGVVFLGSAMFTYLSEKRSKAAD